MRKEFRHALDDMLVSINGIQNALAGKTFEDFEQQWVLLSATQRGIEVISEASRALPDDIKALRPDVPWAKIRDVGNVLRHQYYGLSNPIIWAVVQDELPSLKIAIEQIFEIVGQE